MACPCKQKLTDEQKALINSQNGRSFVRNTTGGQAGAVGSGLSQSVSRLTALAAAVTNPGGAGTIGNALGQTGVNIATLNNVIGNVNTLQTAVNAFKSQADRLSNPQTLMSIIGSMNFYANLGCALGIEGLDVTLSIGVLTGNGQNAISVAGNVNLDLERLLDNFSRNPSGNGAESAARDFNAGLEGIVGKINQATGLLNDVTNKSVSMINQAAAAILNYSQINFFSNLVGEANDPCNKMGVAVNTAGILTPEFQQLAGAANASVTSPFVNSGSTTTR